MLKDGSAFAGFLQQPPGVVAATAALWCAVGPQTGSKCSAVQCLGDRQQLTFQWSQVVEGHKFSELLTAEVLGTVAAVTRSKASRPAPVVTESELPMSDTGLDSQALEEPVHALDLSQFQKRCIAAYEQDPDCKDESWLSQLTARHGLWWSPDGKLAQPNADNLRQ